MTELDWETRLGRAEAAALLRRVADGLERGDKVELEHGGLELKLGVAEEVELEIEVEIDGPETDVEIELSWSTGAEGSGSVGEGDTESLDARFPDGTATDDPAGAAPAEGAALPPAD